ncbi:mechanosensitive ion channel family protein [Tunturiibacter lichenicola]|uniref:mechanosensitive ion channel family protein n=1 Tax=Tunturiibacter lichenicola TaxID=2051959 RepID=UPI003D9BFA40
MKSGMNQNEKSEQQVIVQRQRRIPSLLVWVALVLPNIVFLGGGVVGLARAQVKNSPQRPDKSDDSQEPKPDKNAAAENNKKVSARGVPGFDLQSSRTDILSHLNAVISFYRASLMPIQKAGEPNDAVYFDQSVELSSQAATYAFQAAQAGAALAIVHQDVSTGDRQRLENTKTNVEQALVVLKNREDSLDKAIAAANSRQISSLRLQREGVQAAIDLNNSMDEALKKIVGISDTRDGSGLAADVERLQRSIPELNGKEKIVAPQLTTLESARSSGVSSQGAVLFQLLETKHALDGLISQNDKAHQTALAVRVPISAVLRTLVTKGQLLTEQAVEASVPPQATTKKMPAATPTETVVTPPMLTSSATSAETLGSITRDFQALSSAAIPLSQELIVLEESRSNLTAWQAAVDQEYKGVLHALLLRVVVIAIALGIIFVGGEVWRRATNKYVHDPRRRRQLLVVRRIAIGFLSVIVVLFGFVTQFNSLATFAGFITAGIAVGLQTVLLSVAAYFFIVGRYGVKVGDRITVSSVTGDVIDVGLVRFYMMELAGSGVEMNPTGRVAVFSNAVLFQAATPLYKQIPGTEFAWHELIVKLSATTNYTKVCDAIMNEVKAVYEGYRPNIEQQHRDVENWMQAPIAAPEVNSRLQFSGGAFQLWARFPVEIRTAAKTDEELTIRLMRLMEQNDEFKQAFAATPVIQASVKG